MIDGIGTTEYHYYPAGVGGGGKLYQTAGPFLGSTITFNYDELGRITSQDINGTPASIHYDSLDRVDNVTNEIGSFQRVYDNVTSRVIAVTYPNGQTSNYSYYDNFADHRLQTLQNLAVDFSTLSEFDYTYDPEGQIQTLGKALGGNQTGLSLVYDNAKRLTNVSEA